jgi:Fungal protein of unknown function (DUF2015)
VRTRLWPLTIRLGFDTTLIATNLLRAREATYKMLFYVSILAFVSLFVMCKSYHTASFCPCESLSLSGKVGYRYRAHLPVPDRLRAIIPSSSRENYAPLSTFADQAAAGMTSSTFDIEADNIFQGDARVGLDEQATQEVMEIMRRENVT